jgi:hypothetical protein
VTYSRLATSAPRASTDPDERALMITRGLPHVDPEARLGALYCAYAPLLGTRPMGWVSRLVVWRLDPILLRETRGRVGMGLALPTALLETPGAAGRRAATASFTSTTQRAWGRRIEARPARAPGLVSQPARAP